VEEDSKFPAQVGSFHHRPQICHEEEQVNRSLTLSFHFNRVVCNSSSILHPFTIIHKQLKDCDDSRLRF